MIDYLAAAWAEWCNSKYDPQTGKDWEYGIISRRLSRALKVLDGRYGIDGPDAILGIADQSKFVYLRPERI